MIHWSPKPWSQAGVQMGFQTPVFLGISPSWARSAWHRPEPSKICSLARCTLHVRALHCVCGRCQLERVNTHGRSIPSMKLGFGIFHPSGCAQITRFPNSIPIRTLIWHWMGPSPACYSLFLLNLLQFRHVKIKFSCFPWFYWIQKS